MSISQYLRYFKVYLSASGSHSTPHCRRLFSTLRQWLICHQKRASCKTFDLAATYAALKKKVQFNGAFHVSSIFSMPTSQAADALESSAPPDANGVSMDIKRPLASF
jgi:hypothetical protein